MTENDPKDADPVQDSRPDPEQAAEPVQETADDPPEAGEVGNVTKAVVEQPEKPVED